MQPAAPPLSLWSPTCQSSTGGGAKTIAEQLRAIPVTKELMGDLTAARKAWCEQGGKENISFCKPTAAAPRMSVQ